jgi:hypothetical protein
MLNRLLAACERRDARITTRDGLIGAMVMLGATIVLAGLGIAARRNGWPTAGLILTSLSFPGSLVLSMPFWLTKGQPWKTQLILIGTVFTLLVAIGYLSTLV